MGCGASKVAAEEKKDKALKSHSSKKKRDEQKGGDEWWRQKVTPGECVAKYEYGRVLGRGASSVVREATCRKTGERVACKIVTIKGVKHSERVKHRESALREVDVWSSVNHDGIVNLVEFFVETDNVTLVMELCRGNTLLDEVLDRGGYSVEDARHIMQQVLKTMAYLHECRVVHRDLKLENLLLRRKRDLGSVKLADMGFSTRLDAKGFYHTMAGTPAYLAPELIRVIEGRKGAERNFGTATDMWSAGVSLFILLGGYPPFDADTTKEVFARVELEPVSFNSPVWENVGQDAKELIKKLLHKDPSKRYTAQEALEDKWIISNQKANNDPNLETSFVNLRSYLSHSSRPQTSRTTADIDVSDLRSSFEEPIPHSTFLEMQMRHEGSRGRRLNESLRRIFRRNANTVKPAKKSPAHSLTKSNKSWKEKLGSSYKDWKENKSFMSSLSKSGRASSGVSELEKDLEDEELLQELDEAKPVNSNTHKLVPQYFDQKSVVPSKGYFKYAERKRDEKPLRVLSVESQRKNSLKGQDGRPSREDSHSRTSKHESPSVRLGPTATSYPSHNDPGIHINPTRTTPPSFSKSFMSNPQGSALVPLDSTRPDSRDRDSLTLSNVYNLNLTDSIRTSKLSESLKRGQMASAVPTAKEALKYGGNAGGRKIAGNPAFARKGKAVPKNVT